MKGFTFYMRGKDYFYESKRENITDGLAKEMLEKMEGYSASEGNIRALKKRLRKATCEIKTLPSGKQYYKISGENFGGLGSFIDDGETIIL